MSEDIRAGEPVADLATELLRHLSWLSAAGVREVPPTAPLAEAAVLSAPRSVASATAPERPLARPVIPAAPVSPSENGTTPPSPPEPPGQPAAVAPAERGCGSEPLARIRSELGDCTRCKLAGGRTKLVFGVGDPAAPLVFVGEGPGADEDREGEPFVGRAGQLLTRMIEAMGYRREQVYIANVVKCRPPGNRNPEPDEIAACEPFLRAQLEAIGPRVIVALGKFAAQTLLRDPTPITRLRGRWAEYQGVRLMPTFHPAYLLRSPEEKRKAWEDLQLVMKELARTPGR